MNRKLVPGFVVAFGTVAFAPGCDSTVTPATGGSGSTSSTAETGASTSSSSSNATTTSTSGASSTSSGTSGGSGCTIVPLYAYPTDGTTWTDLAAAAKAHPSVEVVAIINPDSGPGAAADPVFSDGIAALQAANVRVVGYVATGYGSKSMYVVNAETDKYALYYPGLDGMFFDEMSSDEADVSKYSNVGAHAGGAIGGITIGNPGTSVPIALLTTMERVVVYENPGQPAAAEIAAATKDSNAAKFVILPYGVSTLDAAFVAEARTHARCIYVTNDVEPNPWDSLPPYFDALLTALE